MSRKNTLPYQIASSQSLAASFTTTPTIIRFADNVSYQINVTTSNSTGTFSVQVSNDYAVSETNAVTNAGSWDSLTLSGVPVAAAANDVIAIALNQLPYGAIRIAYTPTIAGTGTCDIYFLSKQLGG